MEYKQPRIGQLDSENKMKTLADVLRLADVLSMRLPGLTEMLRINGHKLRGLFSSGDFAELPHFKSYGVGLGGLPMLRPDIAASAARAIQSVFQVTRELQDRFARCDRAIGIDTDAADADDQRCRYALAAFPAWMTPETYWDKYSPHEMGALLECAAERDQIHKTLTANLGRFIHLWEIKTCVVASPVDFREPSPTATKDRHVQLLKLICAERSIAIEKWADGHHLGRTTFFDWKSLRSAGKSLKGKVSTDKNKVIERAIEKDAKELGLSTRTDSD